MKLKVASLTVEDAAGKYGPQKKIIFTEDNGRRISGWIAEKAYNADEWKIGTSTPEIEVAQNGNFWNFKLPSNSPAAKATQQTTQASAQILALLTEVNERLKVLEKRVISIEPTSTVHPFES